MHGCARLHGGGGVLLQRCEGFANTDALFNLEER